ncbi:MAG TPA: ferredoxin [Vicinamibacteria bacterium]|jgi:ferredoxin
MQATGERIRANAWGRFYVTDECNGCGLCASFAPDNFGSSWDGSYYAIAAQPANEDEERAVREAMDVCPDCCIRDDGDE